jgi:hypothetical protein
MACIIKNIKKIGGFMAMILVGTEKNQKYIKPEVGWIHLLRKEEEDDDIYPFMKE